MPWLPFPHQKIVRRRYRYQPQTPLPVSTTQTGSISFSATSSLTENITQDGTITFAGASTFTASTGAAYIAGLAGSGAGYFVDQYGQPRMVLGDNPWALIPNAGRWSGTWQSDIDTYVNNRGSQGFTVLYVDPLGNTENNGAFADGRTWDGVFPFTVNGTAGSTASIASGATLGLNSTFWARVDYFLTACARNGITAFLNVGYSGPGDFASGAAYTNMTTTHWGQYGAALAARYASTGNIVWMVGNDYFGGTIDSDYSALLTGIRGGGDTHVVSIHNMAESTSRTDTSNGSSMAWGASNAQFNFCYSYNVTYYGVEKAYLESSPIPVLQGDGYFYQGGSTYFATNDRAFRQDSWHAISSGSRGIIQGSESIWQWTSTSLASSATDWYHVNNAGNIRTLIESLADWQKLVPDTSSVLVTAGRGTHASGFTSGGGGGQYEPATTDAYVTASRSPDTGSGSSLAVIYLSHAATITIDQTKMVSGYQAYRADPVTGTKTLLTSSSSYNSSSWGNNSQGDPDWVLILQAPVSITTNGTLSVTAASSFSEMVTELSPAVFTTASSLSGFTVQGSGSAFNGQATLAPTVVQGSSVSLSAASSWLSKATQNAGAVFSSAASAAFSGVNQLVNLSLTGASSFTGNATQQAGTTMNGSSTLGVAVTQVATNVFNAASSFASSAVQIAGTALSAVASFIANPAGSVSGTISMAVASTYNAVANQIAGLSLQPASTFLAGVTQQASTAFTAATSFAAQAVQTAGASFVSAASFVASSSATAFGTVTMVAASAYSTVANQLSNLSFQPGSSLTGNALLIAKQAFTAASSVAFNAGSAVFGTVAMAASSAWQAVSGVSSPVSFTGASQLTGKAIQATSLTLSAVASLTSNMVHRVTAGFSTAASFTGSLFTGSIYGRSKITGKRKDTATVTNETKSNSTISGK